MARGGFAGFVFGPILIVGALALLFWNEGRAVQSARSLAEGAGLVVSVGADAVDPANEGRLVHVTGRADTDARLADPDFGVSAKALRLVRDVEMYQWVQKGSSKGRGTKLSYEKEWRDEPVDHAKFEVPEGHENPAAWEWAARTWTADGVTLGAFRLSQAQVLKLPADSPVEPPAETALSDRALSDSARRARPMAGGFYVGDDPAKAQVGDCRVTFRAALPGDVSVIARQTGGTFAPYQTESGDALSIVRPGVFDAAALFQREVSANTALTWGLRVFGAILLFAGFAAFASPLTSLARWVPVLGRVVSGGVAIVSGLLALILGTTTIAVAWIFYRPLVGIPLLLVAGALVVLLVRRARRPASPAAADPASD